MVKPDTMSVKEHISRKLSQELDLPLATIKVVIDNQFSSALAALKTNDSLEIAGLGKFIFNRRILTHQIRRLEESIVKCTEGLKNPLLPQNLVEDYTKKVLELPGELEYLKQRAISFDAKVIKREKEKKRKELKRKKNESGKK